MIFSAKRSLRTAIAVAAAAAFAIVPSAASAGPLVADAPNCDAQTLGQVFLPFADPAFYTISPGGSFEPGSAAWSLNGASVASGNEPSYVTSATDSRSLSLPNGSSATSRSICVGIEHPDMRFFVKGSNSLATLTVEVLFEDANGNVHSAPIGAATGGAWSLSAPMPLVVNLLPLLPGSRTAVAFRFSAAGGSFSIDDVYVDPYRWG